LHNPWYSSTPVVGQRRFGKAEEHQLPWFSTHFNDGTRMYIAKKTITATQIQHLMETSLKSLGNLDNEEVTFFRQITKELSLEDPREVVQLVASVLQALRQTLPLDRANAFLNELPDFLKLAFASNWRLNEHPVKIDHLDEFVSLLMVRDRKNRKFLFKSEVFALSVVILTLKKLYKLYDFDKFKGLSQAFRQELREVPTDAVAA
jgi:uncharacterized protein (DUF2267 family)